MQSLTRMRLAHLPLPLFALIAAVVLGAAYLDVLPGGMVGAFALMIVLGAILDRIGDRLPVVKDYLGGGPIVVIFGAAALFRFHVLPAPAHEICRTFMKGGGFLDFYIAALITGSILGMNRRQLLRASARYLPAIAGGVAVALLLAGLAGWLLGYGGMRAVCYIGIPIMGGGMGAGAVPLSEIFGEALERQPEQMLSIMIPAVALGNALSIVAAGLLDKLGRVRPALTGNGELLIEKRDDHVVHEDVHDDRADLRALGGGLLLSVSFYVLGELLGRFVPLHPYALMIISVAVVKACGMMPREMEQAAHAFFRFMMVNLTPTLLVGIGAAYTDLDAVAGAFSLQYLVLVTVTVTGAMLGSAFVGRLVGFYPVESAITAGLCMANMGGTGDVAVLSAARRMELMPFAQISSRLGGAFIILLATALIKLFAP
ncbi:2-hydroxycarboxylate transporter family protein [bacterium]|nr:2-hydroxycarboxylate transporter family protein [bacterium]